jgi:hypothetical protein
MLRKLFANDKKRAGKFPALFTFTNSEIAYLSATKRKGIM